MITWSRLHDHRRFLKSVLFLKESLGKNDMVMSLLYSESVAIDLKTTYRDKRFS